MCGHTVSKNVQELTSPATDTGDNNGSIFLRLRAWCKYGVVVVVVVTNAFDPSRHSRDFRSNKDKGV